jgi:hypothetical protein
VNVVDCPRNVVTELTLGVIVKVGATTVTSMLAVVVAAPLAPFTGTLYVPEAVLPATATVAVAVAPGLTVEGLKVILTPAGAVAVSATAAVYPVAAPTVMLKVVDCPWNIVADEVEGVNVSAGEAIVIASFSAFECVPVFPVITTVPLPMLAVLAAVTVTVVDDPVARLEGLKLKVTPAGADAVRATVPLKPFIPATESVNVVFAPGNSVIEGVEGFKARLGCAPVPDAGHSFARSSASTEPSPVARL